MPPVTTFDPEVVKANQALVSPKAISSTELTSSASPLSLQSFNQTDPRELQGVISSIPNFGDLIGQTDGDSETAVLQNDLRSEILRSLQTIQGRDQAQFDAEAQAGIPEQNRELQQLSGRLGQLRAESMAIPLQIQEEFTGRGATVGGVEPIQTSRLRQNAIQSLTIGAQAQALQGNIALAQEQVNRAVDLQFAPEENRLKFLSAAYEMNKDALEREDKQRADRLKLQIDERNRILEDNKEQQKGIYNIMNTVSSYGAPQSVVDKLRTARSIDEAIAIASPYMQDPAAKQQLLNAKLDYQLKMAQLAKTQRETALLGQPTEAELKEIAKLQKEAEASLPILKDKALLLGVAKQHPGMKSVVGTFETGNIPFVGGLLDVAGIGRSRTSFRNLTGESQQFIGAVNKIVSGLTLEELIEAKNRGATFGALSEGELRTLASAASQIGTWEIKDEDGKVIGYNIDEASMKRELQTIEDLTNRAIQTKQGTLFSTDETSLLDETFSGFDDPLSYFPQ